MKSRSFVAFPFRFAEGSPRLLRMTAIEDGGSEKTGKTARGWNEPKSGSEAAVGNPRQEWAAGDYGWQGAAEWPDGVRRRQA